ncbi:unnamed protein product [Chrysoparadoxa australica]
MEPQNLQILWDALNFSKDIAAIFLRSYYWLLTARVTLAWFPNINPYIQPFFMLIVATEEFVENFEGFIPDILGIDMSTLLSFLYLEWMIRLCKLIKFG